MWLLSEHPSVAAHFIAELRDEQIQRDAWRFRQNLERIGQVLAYEISRTLDYQTVEVQTPLGTSAEQRLVRPPVLAPILRAALPMHQGFLRFFDRAENAFVAAYRGHYRHDNSFEVYMEYAVTPQLDGKVLILIDPMLATGQSLMRAYEALLRHGNPAQVHVAVAIAAQAGVDFLTEHLPDVRLWLGALDPTLDQKSYIVPGLGDAGDLAYGTKI